MGNTKFETDNLFVMAMEAYEHSTPESELIAQDLTEVFLYELDKRIASHELVNININGQVRLGKSTLAQAICILGKASIEKHHDVERPFTTENICRDQGEYGRQVKKRTVKFKHEFDVIDEWAQLEQTGLNATIEEAFLRQFSDVQAGRYYHRISCSPTAITDPNTDILLHVLSVDKKEQTTLALLSYQLYRNNATMPILLGHIRLSVKGALEHPAYKEYLRQKEEKWDLMNRHNVRSVREMEYAQIILESYNELHSIAKLGLTDRKYLKSILLNVADKHNIWFSILGINDVLETLQGLCDMQAYVIKFEKKLAKAKDELEKQAYQDARTNIKRNLGVALARQSELAELYLKYNRVGQKSHA